MECKKCPYFENRKEIAAGKVLVGYCKLRNKYMSDTTKGKELCKDRATVDIPAEARRVEIKPEPSLFTEREKAVVSKAMHKPVERPSPSSPTLADMAARRPNPATSPRPNMIIGMKQEASTAKPSNIQNPRRPEPAKQFMPAPKTAQPSKMEIPALMKPQDKRPFEIQEPAQVVPPLKMTPQDAMRLLDEQLSGRINAKFSKPDTEGATKSEKDVIRRAVWGGGA